MTRKILTSAMAVAVLLLSVLSFGAITDTASAQTLGGTNCDYDSNGICRPGGRPTCPYQVGVVLTANDCAPALAYPGPFTNMPTTPGGPYGWGSLNPVVGTVDVTPDAGGGTGGGLAHTGSESTVLGYVGTGLIAFGAVALGSRRKFFQGALED